MNDFFRIPGLRWSRLLWPMVFVLGLVLALVSLSREALTDEEKVTGGHGLILTIDGAIGPATMDYVVRGLQRAAEEKAEIVVLQMDTPGGLMESMRDIIKEILLSPVPVATYVSPSGARAASAGTYILYGSHIAAMAPATNLGSATPVQMGGLPWSPDEKEETAPSGEDTGKDGETVEAGGKDEEQKAAPSKRRGDSALERKTMEDAVAYIRGLAEKHGRNADWAEMAVREAENLGAREALEKNVIDVVAADVADLLSQIDGRTVAMADGERTLATADLEMIRHDPDWRTRLLSVITDPNIAYFLMIIGFYGIIYEFINPGGLISGVVGAICLVLALFAFQVLSVNFAGLALILLGLIFIVAEAFMPSFGIMGIGGLVAFVVGSIILMDGTNLEISLPLIGGTSLVAGGFLLWAVTRFMTLRRRPVVSGVEQMRSEKAVALEDFRAEDGVYKGRVWLSGERWNAVSRKPVARDQQLMVEGVEGLTARVVGTEKE